MVKVIPAIWRNSEFSSRSTNYVPKDFKPKPIAPAEAKSLSLCHSKEHVDSTEIKSAYEGYGLTKKKKIKYEDKLFIIHWLISAILFNISRGHFWC